MLNVSTCRRRIAARRCARAGGRESCRDKIGDFRFHQANPWRGWVYGKRKRSRMIASSLPPRKMAFPSRLDRRRLPINAAGRRAASLRLLSRAGRRPLYQTAGSRSDTGPADGLCSASGSCSRRTCGRSACGQIGRLPAGGARSRAGPEPRGRSPPGRRSRRPHSRPPRAARTPAANCSRCRRRERSGTAA